MPSCVVNSAEGHKSRILGQDRSNMTTEKSQLRQHETHFRHLRHSRPSSGQWPLWHHHARGHHQDHANGSDVFLHDPVGFQMLHRNVPFSSTPTDVPDSWQSKQSQYTTCKFTPIVEDDVTDDEVPADLLRQAQYGSPLIQRWGVDARIIPETIVLADDRLQVSPCKSPPYCWVCYLEMTAQNGEVYMGTGAFSNVGNTPGVILTCAHNIYHHSRRGYIDHVDVYPARDGSSAPFGHFRVYSTHLRVPDLYKKRKAATYDYGLILIPKKEFSISTKPFGFGYNLLASSALKGRLAEICGYPGDKPNGTMWIAGSPLKYASRSRLYYEADTAAGQSGSPVWTWDNFNWMMVGIHGKGVIPGGTLNSARRLTPEVIQEIHDWIKEIKDKEEEDHVV
ncbi:uncharacterized protein LOC106167294 [Lingula anatina]|uniref:Serine protease n=2 Tax=Lingula anatina TaxID=7574 RepID=A0A1S3ITS9_LINAN|nr:uncharacterized protein LOC106167294 [Lingula anatina]|eukprot:XP_013401488.1 uncharacterized protein LOC106167294 [Lingula anatina]